MSEIRAVPLSRSVKLAGSELTCSCHACAFFSSDDEEQAVLAPFAKDGLAANDRLVQIINNQHRDDRVRRLKAEGIDVDAATARGQLEMRPWEQAYLSGGNGFDQDAMLDLDPGRPQRGPEQRIRNDPPLGQHGMGAGRPSGCRKDCRIRDKAKSRSPKIR